MIVVDASVWVSASFPDEVRHVTSRRWLDRVLGEDVVIVPSLGLAEIAGAISRVSGSTTNARRAIDSIQQLPNLQVVIPDVEVWVTAVRLAAERRLRGADSVYVAMALLLDCPLATWDQEILTRARRDIETTTPN